jgi:hypothetical protein
VALATQVMNSFWHIALSWNAGAVTGQVMAVAIYEIAPQAWRPYFEERTDALGTVEATIEVVGHDVGAQVADERQTSRTSPTTIGTT